MEEASTYQRLIKNMAMIRQRLPKWFQKPQLHRKYGQAIKTRTEVQQMLIDKKITSSHAKVLLSSDNQIEATKDVIVDNCQ